MATKPTHRRSRDDKTAKRRHDRKLRELVFECLADSSHAPAEAIAQMQLYVDWIRAGHVPGGGKIVRIERETA